MKDVTVKIRPVEFGAIKALASITLDPLGLEIRGIRIAHPPHEDPWVDWPSKEFASTTKPGRFQIVHFPLMNHRLAMEQTIIRAYREKTKKS